MSPMRLVFPCCASVLLLAATAAAQPEPPPAPPAPPPPPQVPAHPGVTLADPLGDRITFGDDAFIAPGERVRDVITMGGDAVVEGEVHGDVVTMGGDLRVREGAVVHGEVVTMGGDVDVAEGAALHGGHVAMGPHVSASGGGIQLVDGDDLVRRAVGPWESLGEWIYDAITGAVSFALLFLLGLVLIGLAPARMSALHAALIRDPARAAAHGLLAIVAFAVAVVVLCITVIGIPVAVLLALIAPVAVYVGLAAVAQVLGAALPLRQLSGKPVLQLAAGVAAMFLVSLVPYLGAFALAIAATFGLGAMVLTRFADRAPTGDPTPAGPYRTAAADL